MKLGLFVGSALLLASFAALAPAAMANHDCLPNPNAYPCLRIGGSSFGDGDCDTAAYGGHSNFVTANTGPSPAGYVGASASAYCYQYNSFSYNSIGASAYTSGGPAGYNYGSLSWYGYDSPNFDYCYSRLYTYSGGQYSVQDLPLCSAVGNPPDLPKL